MPIENKEIVFVMTLELLGIAVYSYIVATLFSIRFRRSSSKIIAEKKLAILNFLSDIKTFRKSVMPEEIIVQTLSNLEVIYQHDLNNMFNDNEMFLKLKPQLQKGLLIKILQQKYEEFYYFFNNNLPSFTAADKFISSLLSSFEYSIHLPDKIIVNRRDKFEKLYFISSGSVQVKNYAEGDVL